MRECLCGMNWCVGQASLLGGWYCAREMNASKEPVFAELLSALESAVRELDKLNYTGPLKAEYAETIERGKKAVQG